MVGIGDVMDMGKGGWERGKGREGGRGGVVCPMGRRKRLKDGDRACGSDIGISAFEA